MYNFFGLVEEVFQTSPFDTHKRCYPGNKCDHQYVLILLTLPEANSSPLKIPIPKRKIVSQSPLFGGELLALGSVKTSYNFQVWLVVSTHLKNISKIGNLPEIRMKIKNV